MHSLKNETLLKQPRKEMVFMRLNSDYRIFTLKAVAYFIVLPVDHRSLTVLINTFPVLENSEKFIRACQKLQMKGLVKFLNLFDETGKRMDAVTITTAGLKYLKSIGFDPTVGREYRYKKSRNFDTKILMLKQNQIEILAHSGINLNEYGGKLLTRDEIIQNLIKIDLWQHYLQFKAARVNAVLMYDDEYIPIYNVMNKNIIINPKSEMGFYKGISESTSLKRSKKTLIFSPSSAVFEKTIMAKNIPFDRKQPSSLGQQSIYSINDYNKALNQYLILNSIEQSALFLLHSINDVVKLFVDTVKIIENRESTVNSSIVPSYDIIPSLVFETEDEVGVNIIMQNMYTLRKLYEACEHRDNGKSADKRKIIIYGLSLNNEIYETLFSKYDFIEFKYFNTEDFLNNVNNGGK